MLHARRITIVVSILLVGSIISYLGLAKKTSHSVDVHVDEPAITIDETDGHNGHTSAIASERDFIAHMIPHHEEAVLASQALLAADVPLQSIQVLAESIITTQQKEIDQLRAWYEGWYGVPYDASTVSYTPMMRDVYATAGDERMRAFLEDMIVHHEAAITMADTVVGYPVRDEIRTLAKNIIATQQDEVTLMQSILATLP